VVINRLENLPFIEKINYKRWVDFETGEEYIKHFFNLDGILFYWDAHKLRIQIKPHYYFNKNIHNANNFSPLDSIKTIQDVVRLLQLENGLKRLKIVGLEYGVNFVIDAIDTNVLDVVHLHSTNQFYNIKDLPYCKISYQPKPDGKANQHKQYKFYAKAIQHPDYCEPNTLRAEVRSNRSAYINTLGIETLDDLLNLNVYDTLREHLNKETAQLLFIDPPQKIKGLTRKQRAKLKAMNNPIFWRNTLKNNRSKFTRLKRDYFDYLNKTGYNLTGLVITGVKNKLNQLFNSETGLTSSTPIIEESGLTSTYSIGRYYTTFKTCPVTGENITMQNRDSLLLSNTGLKKLEETNPKRFKELVNKYITGNHNKYETTIYSQLSKQIRNEYFNSQHQQKRLYPVEQTNLFNISA
jgi:hypothetical protein